jgi:hypothetical protein
MTTRGYRITIGVLWILVGLQTLGCGVLFLKQVGLAIQLAFAIEQTEYFEETRVKALQQGDPTKAAVYLHSILGYYPSGTKQVMGSQLDIIVERARQSAIREILADLRKKTGKDLGDEPQRWIQALKPDGR